MSTANGIVLAGLEGTNPLGFLAALGVQVAFAGDDDSPRLWWNSDVTPRAVVDAEFDLDRIADRTIKACASWHESRTLNPQRPNGTPMPKGDALKLAPCDLREYLSQHRKSQAGRTLATALLAEGSLDNSGVAKPSDLYFAAGQVVFLREARKILAGVTSEHVCAALQGPWKYQSPLPSMGWDVVDDRVYALRSDDPSKDKKLTNPGAEALAILGMSLYPVFAGRDRTLTQGCSGAWKRGLFSWPLWERPMQLNAVRSVLAQTAPSVVAAREGQTSDLDWLRSLSVRQVLTSTIRRSSQGGYGSFAPPTVTWTNPADSVASDSA